jgi:hypothetical protein
MGGILTARHLLDTRVRSGVLRVRATASLMQVKAPLVHSGPARANVNIQRSEETTPHLYADSTDRLWNEWAKVVRRILRAPLVIQLCAAAGLNRAAEQAKTQ